MFFYNIFKGYTSSIPYLSDALFWLNGEVVGEEFVDKSGNGRNFTITDRDFTADYFPYKTAATVSAPVGDAVLIAADVNNFLYTSGGTPNDIPVVSFFQNIDYEDKLFCKHVAQVVNASDVETSEPYILDIVLYDTALTGTALTAASSYYGVPTEDSSVEWVSKDGNDTTGDGTKLLPWLTLVKGSAEVAAGNTVYGESGVFDENGAQSALYLAKAQAIKGTGFTTVTAPSVARVLYLDGGANAQSFKHLVIDGEGTTSVAIELNNPSSNKEFDKVLVKGSTSNGINTEATGTAVDILNSVFTGAGVQASVRGVANVLTNLFSGACVIGVNIDDSGGTNTFTVTNNKFNIVSTTSEIYIGVATIEAIIKGNVFTPVNSKQILAVANSASAIIDLNFSYNIISGYTNATPIRLENLAVVDNAVIDNNTFNLNASHMLGTMFIENQLDSVVTNNIITCLGSTNNIQHIWIISDGGDAHDPIVRNNIVNYDITDGLGIAIGNEGPGAWTNKLLRSIVEKNVIYGAYYNSANTSANVHEILIGDQTHYNARYNFVNGGGIGFIVKGEQVITDGVTQYNLFENCRKPIYINGVSGAKVYNNTIYNDGMNSTASITLRIEGAQGATNTVIKNNIIITSGLVVDVDTDSYSGLDIDYNIYYDLSGSISFRHNVTDYTFSEWQGLGHDLNSTVLNESEFNALFTDAANGDFSLAAGSQAIDAGEDLGATYDDGLDESTEWGDPTTLPVVATKQQTGSWDCGAYVS